MDGSLVCLSNDAANGGIWLRDEKCRAASKNGYDRSAIVIDRLKSDGDNRGQSRPVAAAACEV